MTNLVAPGGLEYANLFNPLPGGPPSREVEEGM